MKNFSNKTNHCQKSSNYAELYSKQFFFSCYTAHSHTIHDNSTMRCERSFHFVCFENKNIPISSSLIFDTRLIRKHIRYYFIIHHHLQEPLSVLRLRNEYSRLRISFYYKYEIIAFHFHDMRVDHIPCVRV